MYVRERQYVLHAYSDVLYLCWEKPCTCGLFVRKSPVNLRKEPYMSKNESSKCPLCMCVYLHVHVHVYICVHIYICIYVNVYMYIYL